MNFNKLLIEAINASILGGNEILKIYNTDFRIEEKSDNSPLTKADKNCNEVIQNCLKSLSIPILSEEGAEVPFFVRKTWDYFWLIDPLDGTKEFIKKNGEFTVNISLVNKGNPVMGIVYVPVTNVLYFASENLGSFKSVEKDTISSLDQLIKRSEKLPLNQNRNNFVMVGSRSHMSRETLEYFGEMEKLHEKVEIISKGSSLKLCMVAEGTADVYPRFAPTMEWDTAAGDAICRIAGFSVLQYDSELLLKYNKEELLNPWFIVK